MPLLGDQSGRGEPRTIYLNCLICPVRRHPRGERVPGHVDSCVGCRVWPTEAHANGTPVADVRHGTALQHPRLRQR